MAESKQIKQDFSEHPSDQSGFPSKTNLTSSEHLREMQIELNEVKVQWAPLQAFLDLAYAFSGVEQGKTVKDNIQSKDVLGGLAKYIFSQQPSIQFCEHLSKNFVKEQDFNSLRREIMQSELQKIEMQTNIKKQ